MRHCNRCGADKPATRDHWYFQKNRPSGNCKECRKAAARAEYQTDPAKFNLRQKGYREARPDAYRESGKRARVKNAASVAAQQRASYLANQEARVAYERARRESGVAAEQERARRAADPEKYRQKDRDRRRRPDVSVRCAADQRAARRADPERYRAYDTKRYASPKGNLDRRVAVMVTSSLKKCGACKSKPKALLTGWKIDELIVHLSDLFEHGMSFENYGEWDLDHIVPLSKIAYASEDDPLFKAAWSLDNLAPLWSDDNGRKHARLDWVLPDTYRNPQLRAAYASARRDLAA